MCQARAPGRNANIIPTMPLNPVSNPQTLVLLSGGLDSAVCLDYYIQSQHKTQALFVDYGQPSATLEFDAAGKLAGHFRTKLDKIKVDGFPGYAGGFIRGRNAFLLVAALMYFDVSSGLIAIGIHSGTSYSDCGGDFVELMRSIFALYSGGSIALDAPLLNWNKGEIWNHAVEREVPIRDTYSCELGREQPCGDCLSCKDMETLNASAKFRTNA